jgi:hypothetical protein
MKSDKKEWTPKALRRLLAEVEPRHLDYGRLGEYANILQSEGTKRAKDLFPDIAQHIEAGCQECQSEIESISQIIREEMGNESIEGKTFKNLFPEGIRIRAAAYEALPLVTREESADYHKLDDKGKLDWLLANLAFSHFDRESKKIIELPASWRENLFALISKLPVNERKNIESYLNKAIAQLMQKKGELHQRLVSLDRRIESAYALISAIKKLEE